MSLSSHITVHHTRPQQDGIDAGGPPNDTPQYLDGGWHEAAAHIVVQPTEHLCGHLGRGEADEHFRLEARTTDGTALHIPACGWELKVRVLDFRQ